ncbi:MAG: MBL fold metallo-hydrolase [Gemmatimonadota bacterium]|nr:MBL fold metallo-hydrolase [Gemmatimonadota bacterium]HEU4989912.1 MBL fold metallo-hydrolase [Gemmatimonadaceae bacterium]
MSMHQHVETRTIGKWKVHAIQAGGQKLDGGAMFGVVPKPLWERRIPSDEKNRIQMGMRCLLVEHPRGPILIDNGCGNKETDKFLGIYGIENAGAGGRTWLEDGLRQIGVAPEDVALMIDTHLHFDHAGGNTYRDAEGQVRLTFPRARYVVQRAEYLWATNVNERTAASYFTHNFEPVMESGRLELVEGEVEIVPGVTVMPTPGHTPGHQSVRLDSGGETALFMADLVPTAAHLPLPWIMGYDVEPMVTLETKRRILRAASEQQWLVIFEHDADHAWGRVMHDGKAYALGDG